VPDQHGIAQVMEIETVYRGHTDTVQYDWPANDCSQAGHCEGDLIIGKDQGSAIGTLVERQTRMVRLLHLPRRDGDALHDALKARMADLPAALLRTITWDQGTEMARHLEITRSLGAPVYFCDSHSPWQRGSNENTNGLLRDYFPKGTDLSTHSRNTSWRSRTSSTTGPGASSTTRRPPDYSPPC
jgi:IS30 family transposase